MLGALFGLLIVAIVVCCGVGAFPIGPANIARILLSGLGLATADGIPSEQQAVLWSIRLPRVMLAVVIGGGLGAAGAAMQALFRNPLADPSLTGVSGGAALAATSVIVMGASWSAGARRILGVATLPLAAFGGGFVVSVLVYRLATRSGHTSIAALLLAGIALNALAEAGIGLFTFVASDEQLRNLTFWRLEASREQPGRSSRSWHRPFCSQQPCWSRRRAPTTRWRSARPRRGILASPSSGSRR